LVVVLDLSSPIIEDRDIAAMLYGRTVTTMLDPSTPLTTTRDRAEGIWALAQSRPIHAIECPALGAHGATATGRAGWRHGYPGPPWRGRYRQQAR